MLKLREDEAILVEEHKKKWGYHPLQGILRRQEIGSSRGVPLLKVRSG